LHSAWSPSHAIGNVAQMLAAPGVWGSGSGWPDLIVAGAMAGLFFNSSVHIIRQSLAERRGAALAPQ